MKRVSGPPIQGAAVTRQPTKPQCPRHYQNMHFDTGSMVWRCEDNGCQMVAYPKEDVDAGKGKPKVGRGILEVVKSGTSYYLRSADDNVMLEVTGHVTEVFMDSRRVGPTVKMVLAFDNIMEIPE